MFNEVDLFAHVVVKSNPPSGDGSHLGFLSTERDLT